jgi:hypothetical protein
MQTNDISDTSSKKNKIWLLYRKKRNQGTKNRSLSHPQPKGNETKKKARTDPLNKRPKVETKKTQQIKTSQTSQPSTSLSQDHHYPHNPPLGKRSNQISPPVPATHRLQASSYASSKSRVHRAVSKSALLQRLRNSILLSSINLPLPLPLTCLS